MNVTTPALNYEPNNLQIKDVQDKKETYFLLTDTRDSYQEIVKTHDLSENVVWASPGNFTQKPADEIGHLIESVSAVLIDWSIRNAAVLDLLRKNRRNQRIPIVALCGAQEADHVAALMMGADETISRLINPIMLKAKLVAYWRSVEERRNLSDQGSAELETAAAHRASATLSELEIGPLSINLAARSFGVHGVPVQLTPMEFNLMEMLIVHAGTCAKRDDIINQVWGIDYETGTNFLDVHIHALRQKLKNAGAPPCIFTVRGVGYRLEAR